MAGISADADGESLSEKWAIARGATFGTFEMSNSRGARRREKEKMFHMEHFFVSVRISDAEKTLGVGNGAGLFRIHADIDARGYQVGDGKHSENIQSECDNEKCDAVIREQFGIKKRECRDESANECACEGSEDEAQNGEDADAFFGGLGRGRIVRRVREAVFRR